MSQFDHTIHFKFFGYYWNAGIRWKGTVNMDGWKKVWKFYFAKPLNAEVLNGK